MLQLLQQGDLPDGGAWNPLFFTLQTDLLHRHHLARGLVSAFVNHPIGTCNTCNHLIHQNPQINVSGTISSITQTLKNKTDLHQFSLFSGSHPLFPVGKNAHEHFHCQFHSPVKYCPLKKSNEHFSIKSIIACGLNIKRTVTVRQQCLKMHIIHFTIVYILIKGPITIIKIIMPNLREQKFYTFCTEQQTRLSKVPDLTVNDQPVTEKKPKGLNKVLR